MMPQFAAMTHSESLVENSGPIEELFSSAGILPAV
jgi:hypothetical protein